MKLVNTCTLVVIMTHSLQILNILLLSSFPWNIFQSTRDALEIVGHLEIGYGAG